MDIINKINATSFNYDEICTMSILLEMAEICGSNDINEAFSVQDLKSKASGLLKSIGIDAHKSGTGLIELALKSGKLMAEFIYHTIKAAAGDEASKQRVIELSKKEIKKEDVLDFLLRLDYMSLHLLSTPIHMIDALTGWHIGAKIKHGSMSVIAKVKDAVKNLSDVAKTSAQEIRLKIKEHLVSLAKIFGLHEDPVIRSI